MALANGALINSRYHNDGGSEHVISFDGDADYTTGGTPDFTAFLRAILLAAAAVAVDAHVRGAQGVTILNIVAGDCGQYVPWFDSVNDTLKVRDGGHATWNELAAHADVHATKFYVTCVCK